MALHKAANIARLRMIGLFLTNRWLGTSGSLVRGAGTATAGGQRKSASTPVNNRETVELRDRILTCLFRNDKALEPCEVIVLIIARLEGDRGANVGGSRDVRIEPTEAMIVSDCPSMSVPS